MYCSIYFPQGERVAPPWQRGRTRFGYQHLLTGATVFRTPWLLLCITRYLTAQSWTMSPSWKQTSSVKRDWLLHNMSWHSSLHSRDIYWSPLLPCPKWGTGESQGFPHTHLQACRGELTQSPLLCISRCTWGNPSYLLICSPCCVLLLGMHARSGPLNPAELLP